MPTDPSDIAPTRWVCPRCNATRLPQATKVGDPGVCTTCAWKLARTHPLADNTETATWKVTAAHLLAFVVTQYDLERKDRIAEDREAGRDFAEISRERDDLARQLEEGR